MPPKFTIRLLKSALFFVIFTAQFAFAQNVGTLKGVIFDKSTKDNLPSAAVSVKGTNLGAVSDLDGNFIIKNIPAGKQTIVISYIGYETLVTEVEIPKNKTLNKDFGMSFTTIKGAEVVITGQALGQVEAINQQLSADKIASIVSEAKIQELPDFNAAASISRLPGVSTLQSSGEANKVVIRGLAPEFNAVQVEGIRLASTGSTQIGVASQGGTSGSVSNDRSVDLSMITPYMIKSIAVYKSLTPDLNANAVGGVVNMELREAPSDLHYDVLWQSGYTQKENSYGNFRGVGSVSTRFFDDLLGVYLLGNAEQYNRDADNMSASYNITKHVVGSNGYEPVNVANVTLDRHVETRERYGGNAILDFRLPNGSIRSINMFTRLKSDFNDYKTQFDYQNKNINFSYTGGNNTIDLAVNSLQFKNDFGFMELDMKASNTYAFNNLPQEPVIQLNQTGGISTSAPDNTTPENLTRLVTFNGPTAVYMTNVNLFSSKYKENNQAYNVSMKFPVDLGYSVAGYVKVGGDFKYEHHINDQSTPYVTMQRSGTYQTAMVDSLAKKFGVSPSSIGLYSGAVFTNGMQRLTSSFLDNKFGQMYWAVDPTVPVDMVKYLYNSGVFPGKATASETGGFFDGPYQELVNDYDFADRFYSSYAMTDLKYQDISLVGGVRYEKDASEYSAYNMVDSRNPQNQPYTRPVVHPTNEFFLPMVQVKYDAMDWLDVRYAYTQTLARPNYSQLSPHYTMSYNLMNVWAGNPDLKTAEAFNHDLILSFHSTKLGLLTIGGFYKTIKNFSYYTQYKLHAIAPAGVDSLGSFTPTPKDGALVYTYMNSPYNAYVKGLEVDFQTRLWYLPEPFNGIVLGINYTHIKSEATYPWRDDISYANPNWPTSGPRVIVEVKDSTRSGRLINQPNDIVNAYVGYDYKDFAARISCIFQGNSVSYVGAFAEQDGFTKNYFRVDASVRQVLPWAKIEVYLDLNNLNNESNDAAQASIGGFTSEQNYGMTANLGVRYRLQ